MIISAINTKGGSGKSTLVTNLAVGMALSGKSSLICDTDVQGSSLRWESERPESEVKVNVISIPDANALQKQIRDFEEFYHVIFVDGVPQANKMATVTMALSDIVIVPTNPSPYDIWVCETVVERLELAADIHPDLQAYFLLNRFSERTRLSRETEEVLQQMNINVLKSKLGNRIAYPDATLQGLSVLEWTDPKAKKEVEELVIEISAYMEKVKK